MIRTHKRRILGRIKANRCITHNTPLHPHPFLDADICSLGCINGNTWRTAYLERYARPYGY